MRKKQKINNNIHMQINKTKKKRENILFIYIKKNENYRIDDDNDSFQFV